MHDGADQDKLDAGVQELLRLYERGLDCKAFLASLPIFVSPSWRGESVHDCVKALEHNVRDVLDEAWNCAAIPVSCRSRRPI